MTNEVNNVLTVLLQENLPLVELSKKIPKTILLSPLLTDNMVHFTFCGRAPNPIFIKHIIDALSLKIFNPISVAENIQKLSLGSNLNCFTTAIDVLRKCIHAAILLPEDLPKSSICKILSCTIIWMFENTLDTFKIMYALLDEDNSIDLEKCSSVLNKAKQFIRKLVSSKEFEDLNSIGKSLLPAEELSNLQTNIQSFLTQHLNKSSTVNPSYQTFESGVNELAKLASRFLSIQITSTTKKQELTQDAVHIFLQFQVLGCVATTSKKLATLIGTFFQNEVTLCEQMRSLFGLGVRNILLRDNPLEVQLFTSFLFIKVPDILRNFNTRYQVNSDESVIVKTCQMIALDIDFVDLNKKLECNTYTIFVNQCKINNGLDNTQHQQLLALNTAQHVQKSDDGVLNKMLYLSKKAIESLKVLLLPTNENKEKVSQELTNLINLPDLQLLLVTLNAFDEIDSLLSGLFKINKSAERPNETGKEALCDVRADLFNNSFLLLAYIHTLFGDQVSNEVRRHYEDAFFLTWSQNCKLVTSRSLYTQSVLDQLIVPLLDAETGHLPSTNCVQWDEYCWSAGMIVKELTQAHLRHHIKTDVLQKVLEGFKNKRPALCICAMAWLCSQYRTMPPNERGRTTKIIKLFKRTSNQRPSILMPILNKYSLEVEEEFLANPGKGKGVRPKNPESGDTIFKGLVRTVTENSIKRLDNQLINKFRESLLILGPQAFTKSVLLLILESNEEEDVLLNEVIALCLLLLEPFKLLDVILKKTLHSLFNNKKYFADPQGLSTARCIGKLFAMCLILNETKVSHHRSAKVAKVAKNPTQNEQLILSFGSFLESLEDRLSMNESNAVTVFIAELIDQIATATAGMHHVINLRQDVVANLVKTLPVTRETISLVCDSSAQQGCETAAACFLKNAVAF